MQGDKAFKHMHAVLAAEYTAQRLMLLAPCALEQAKRRGAEALARHTAAVAAVQPHPMLLERPTYHGAHSSQQKSYSVKGTGYGQLLRVPCRYKHNVLSKIHKWFLPHLKPLHDCVQDQAPRSS